jgi:uncharacterized protein YlzI (FlbEa/FlbD family)
MQDLKISYKCLCGKLVSKELADRYMIFLENNFYMSFSDFMLFCGNKAKLQKAYSYIIMHNGDSYLEFEICLFFADSEDILMIAEALNNFKILALNCFENIIIKQTGMKFMRLPKNIEHINKEPETFLYLIKNLLTNETKIGYAKNYKSRIRNIISQGGIKKYKYMVFKGNKPQKIEKKLHAIFRHKRMVGEWFILNDKDIFKIKNLMLNEYGFTIENDSIHQS